MIQLKQSITKPLNSTAGETPGCIELLVRYVSGEFLLKRNANGGTLVFVRSCIVTFFIIIVVLPVKSYCRADTLLVFSMAQFKAEVGDVLPWIGPVFAAAYAAFYARFSAQWNYLASLYNQIMAVSVTAPVCGLAAQRMAGWRAAFIEDAIDLHLARKSMFKSAIKHYLSSDQAVVDAFFRGTEKAEDKARVLAEEWEFKVLTPTPTPTSTPTPAPVQAPASASTPVVAPIATTTLISAAAATPTIPSAP